MSGMDILNDLDVSAASLDRAEVVTDVGLEELVGFLPGFLVFIKIYLYCDITTLRIDFLDLLGVAPQNSSPSNSCLPEVFFALSLVIPSRKIAPHCFSSVSAVITLYNVCSVHQGILVHWRVFSTLQEYHEYMGDTMMHLGIS